MDEWCARRYVLLELGSVPHSFHEDGGELADRGHVFSLGYGPLFGDREEPMEPGMLCCRGDSEEEGGRERQQETHGWWLLFLSVGELRGSEVLVLSCQN